MTPHSLLIGVGAGLIAAVVFVSATTGAMAARVVFFLLTPLSIYLAGLGVGLNAALVAGVAATAVIFALSNPATAVVFAAGEAIPAIVLCRLAMLSRGDDDAREWYPPGRLVAIAAIFSGAFAVLVITLLGADIETLTKSLRVVIDQFAKSELPSIPGSAPLTDTQIDEITALVVRMLPAGLALSVMSTMLLNLWLAGRITLASGLLDRPWPDLARLELPQGSALALLAAVVATFAGGLVGLVSGGFFGAFLTAFVVLGLAVVHYVTRGSPWQGFTLAATYISLAIFSAGATLLLALIGLAETVVALRRTHDGRQTGPPPSRPDNDT
ncbi:MAG: DUF2232 domain-containing protein [Hyphomicrobium sp.]